jgi:hypothetical protein
MGFYTVRKDLFDNAGSGLTSATYWVGDAQRISLMCDGSVQTVLGCNQEGRTASLSMNTLNWSTLTRMVASRALMDIQPGYRWLCVQRSGSSGTAILELQQFV